MALLHFRRADQQVVETIAVYVSATAHGKAAFVTDVDAEQREAVGPVERGQVQRGAGRPISLPEHHVTLPRQKLGVSRSGGSLRPDQQVAKAVSVYVSSTAHCKATFVTDVDAEQREAVGPVERGQLQRWREGPIGLSEHDVALPRIRLGVRRRVARFRSDQQVVEAIPVHVPGTADPIAHEVIHIDAEEREAVAPVIL